MEQNRKMKKPTLEELEEVLNKHLKWLNNEVGGERADLRDADLSSANLRDANLRFADLSFANLRFANLRDANLRFADLRFADLRDADLSSANLRDANLRYADLSSANLRYADLSSANLRDANLRYANLRDADLRYADLSDADLMIFHYQKEFAYFTIKDGHLRIGCLHMPISKWVTEYKNIGKEYEYSNSQIKAYGDFIKICAKMFERTTKEKK